MTVWGQTVREKSVQKRPAKQNFRTEARKTWRALLVGTHQRFSKLRVLDLDAVPAAKILRESSKFVIWRLVACCMTTGKSRSLFLLEVVAVERQTRIVDVSSRLVHFDGNAVRHDPWVVVAFGAVELRQVASTTYHFRN